MNICDEDLMSNLKTTNFNQGMNQKMKLKKGKKEGIVGCMKR